MKKAIKFSLLVSLSIVLVSPSASFAKENKDSVIDDKKKKLEIVDKFNKESKKEGLKISWDKKHGIPDFVSGNLSKQSIKNKKDASDFLKEHKDLFDIQAGEFNIKSETKDELGMSHFRAEMTVDGIPVYGTDFIIHTDKQGQVYTMNGQLEPKLVNKKWSKQVKISSSKAIKKAEAFLKLPNKINYTATPEANLYLYQDKKRWLPVYIVELQFIDPYPGREFVFVSAINGKVVHSYNAVTEAATTGTGVGYDGSTKSLNTYQSNGNYYLYDTTKAMNGVIRTMSTNGGTSLPGSYVTDADNNFNSSSQKAAVDAHHNAGVSYDYFYNNFNRNSYDNSGSTITSTVNYSNNYNNAFWNGSQMVYGDGDGSTFSPLSSALDIVAHELTHAVTDTTASLVYQDQSGALNESMSDVFAVLIEAENGSSDWLLGEDVFTPGVEGDALRSVSNPTLYDQPAHMNDYVNTTSDNGGVHINSGIPNKAFYNIASVIGYEKSGDLYYRALTSYLTSQADFNDTRNALLQSATDLFGAGSNEYNAVANGFAAVGIGSAVSNDTDSSTSDGTETSSDNYEPNDTFDSAYGPLTSGTTYQSYISSSSDVDYYNFTAEAGTITVSLTNLPDDYDVYLYNGNGTLVGKSEKAKTNDESISYSASNKGSFFVKVVGYNGASSTSYAYSLNVSYPTSQTEQTAQWYYENVSAETPHPYPNNYNSGHTYEKAGAEKVAIHFSRFETESGYDFVHIKDKNGKVVASYDGTKSAFWAIVDGDKITATLESDYSVTKYGYQIDQVAYYSSTELVNLNKSFTTPIE